MGFRRLHPSRLLGSPGWPHFSERRQCSCFPGTGVIPGGFRPGRAGFSQCRGRRGAVSLRDAEGGGGLVASAVSPPAQRWLSSGDKIGAGGSRDAARARGSLAGGGGHGAEPNSCLGRAWSDFFFFF